MRKLAFITLIAILFIGQPSVYSFSQAVESAQNDAKELTKREQRQLKRQQQKEEKARLKKEQKNKKQPVVEFQGDTTANVNIQSLNEAKEEQVEVQPVHVQKTETSNSKNTNYNNDRVNTSNIEQDNSSFAKNRQSKKSFPTWGWFAILGTIVLAYLIFQYKKYVSRKFAFNIFSISTIVSLLLSFSSILFLYHLIGQSKTGEMWGIPSNNFKFLLITALVITIGILYYFNFRKTNWYLAIINIIIQLLAVGVFVVLVIGWLILKILTSNKSSTTSDTTSQSYTSQATQSSINTSSGNMYANNYSNGQRKWEWDGTYLKLYSNGQREWEYDGRYLKKYSNGQREWEYDYPYIKKYSNGQREWEYDGRYLKKYSNGQREWEYDGIYLIKYSNGQRIMECKNFPIPVIAKAIGII